MLTREQFKKAVNRYIKYVQESDEINKTFSKYHLSGNPTEYPEELEGAFLELLGASMEDDDDMIGWWLFETSAGINDYGDIEPVIRYGSNEIHLDTLDELYDFLA